MKVITYQQFTAQPVNQKHQPCYLLTGKDGYLLDKAAQHAINIIRHNLSSPELITVYGDELNTPELMDYLESYSIFAANRILVLRNADRLGEENKSRKAPEKQRLMLEIITNYLENPEPAQALVIIADSVDGKLTGWKKIKESALQVECNPPRYAGEMTAWLIQTLQSKNIRIDNRAKDLFLSRVELDFCTAENELDKLLILIGNRTAITEQDVITALPTARSGTTTDFYRALGERRTKDLIAKISEMLANDMELIQILGNLSRFFQTLWKIHILKAKHLSPAEIAEKHLTDLFPSARNEYLNYTSRYSYAELVSIFQVLLETDAQHKLSMAEPEVLSTLCIMKICNART